MASDGAEATIDESRRKPALDDLLRSLAQASSDFLDRLVAAAREHLGADVAFLTEFDGDSKVIQHVEGDTGQSDLRVGLRIPLGDTYCYRLSCGELPNIVADARGDARVRDLAITTRFDIGAYIGVPVRLPDGRLYGTLCCISHEPDPTLRERDVRFMQVLGDLIGGQMAQHRLMLDERDRKVGEVTTAMRFGQLRTVFQPIVDLELGTPVGYEALSRFDALPERRPERWFEDAWDVGLGIDLELHAIERALSQIEHVPGQAYLSVNASPLVLQSERFMALVAAAPCRRVLVEVTEHAIVDAYSPLRQALDRLRAMGARIAVDDVGAGYSGLAHVLQVLPGTLKLDIQLNRGISTDPARQALVAAAVGFATRTGIDIVAEGIESAEDADMLRGLGVRYGQGFHFARPGPLPADTVAFAS